MTVYAFLKIIYIQQKRPEGGIFIVDSRKILEGPGTMHEKNRKVRKG
jgi:hypothetical protein